MFDIEFSVYLEIMKLLLLLKAHKKSPFEYGLFFYNMTTEICMPSLKDSVHTSIDCLGADKHPALNLIPLEQCLQHQIHVAVSQETRAQGYEEFSCSFSNSCSVLKTCAQWRIGSNRRLRNFLRTISVEHELRTICMDLQHRKRRQQSICVYQKWHVITFCCKQQ